MRLPPVAQTAVLTLRARADEHRRADRMFEDGLAVDWLEQLEWPPALDRWYTPFAQAKTAIRAHQFDEITRRLLALEPSSAVVELGCGFSTRFERLRPAPPTTWIELDLPEVMRTRQALAPERAGPRSYAGSVTDPGWLDALDPDSQVILLAEGLLYYLPRSEVDALFDRLRRRLSRAIMVFDVIGALDFRRSVKASTRVDAPIRWKVDPPFEAAMADFGLEVIEGLEPERIVAETVAGFAQRYGPLFGAVMGRAYRSRRLGGRRSGIMVGRSRAP